MAGFTAKHALTLVGLAFFLANLSSMLQISFDSDIRDFNANVNEWFLNLSVPAATVTVDQVEEKSHVKSTNTNDNINIKINNVIGYAITFTKCQPDDNDEKNGLDQAAVLLYSIHQNSARNPSSGSKYDYKAYAFLHRDHAANCTDILERIGYHVQIRDSPVEIPQIKGTLRHYVHEASCCQEKEFMKLYSYTLVDHAVVVHLDLDCMVLKPLDDLFNAMQLGKSAAVKSKLQLQWDTNYTNFPDKSNKKKNNGDVVEAFFTRDYNMVKPKVRKPHQVGVQGGFLVIKPDIDVFEQYIATIIDGNYTRDHGWGGRKLRYGGYYGAAQIQGLCAYFFGAIRPGTSVELNGCYYNFMGDDPRDEREDNQCKNGQQECQDCRTVAFQDIKTVHFTECTKPWWCLANARHGNREKKLGGPLAFPLCLQAHRAWYRNRQQLEQVWSEQDPTYNVTSIDWMDNETLAYCEEGYIYRKMTFPTTKVSL